MLQAIIAIIILLLILYVLQITAPFLIIGVLMFIIYKIYESIYFRSKKFLQIKQEIETYINECNDLNRHIEDLKQSNLF
jgi:cell division protein FtsB